MKQHNKFSFNDPIPDIAHIDSMLGIVFNGLGEPIVLKNIVMDYLNELKSVVTKLRAGETLPSESRLFVPDFWQIAKGRAKDVPKEEGDLLFEAQIYGHRLGEAYMDRDYSEVSLLKNKFPGSTFKAKES